MWSWGDHRRLATTRIPTGWRVFATDLFNFLWFRLRCCKHRKLFAQDQRNMQFTDNLSDFSFLAPWKMDMEGHNIRILWLSGQLPDALWSIYGGWQWCHAHALLRVVMSCHACFTGFQCRDGHLGWAERSKWHFWAGRPDPGRFWMDHESWIIMLYDTCIYIYKYDKYVFFLSCLHLHPSIHSQGVRCHILHPIPKCHLHRQCCPRTKQGFGLASRATNSLQQLCTRSLRILRRIWCGIARLQGVFRKKSVNVAFVGSIMRFGSIGAFVGTICSVNVPKHPVASASLVILSGTKSPRPGNAKLELYVVPWWSGNLLGPWESMVESPFL